VKREDEMQDANSKVQELKSGHSIDLGHMRFFAFTIWHFEFLVTISRALRVVRRNELEDGHRRRDFAGVTL
jgi:hypothetical protein